LIRSHSLFFVLKISRAVRRTAFRNNDTDDAVGRRDAGSADTASRRSPVMIFAQLLLHAPAFLLLAFCVSHARVVTPPSPRYALPRIEFSIQVGAFNDPENALRLIESLEECGLEAFYYADDDGLNKVRFGSFHSKELAVRRAEALKEEGMIDEYFIVSPESPGAGGRAFLRDRVARSAMEFLGHPYRWGGPSPETGFDCSGLTMTAYRLNGLALPRTAVEQYAMGESVRRRYLQVADLVFFATGRKRKPSHVGLYVGRGRFIHAPGSGKVVRVDELDTGYYHRRFLGARSYLE
jgi:hypothetical protein